MKKVIIYARVSTSSQEYDRQLEELRSYCKRMDYENEDMKVEAIRNLKKNLATLKTKQKTVTMRYATGEIDKAVFDEVHGDLNAEILTVENELQQLEKNNSNLSKYITKSVEIASKLGGYWRKKDFKLCQKIQKLTFPDGIKWDGEERCFRTDGENVFLAKIALVGASVEGLAKKEQDKSCDLSCLVAGAGLEPATSGL